MPFPSSPYTGQKYPDPPVAGQPTWTYDGKGWAYTVTAPAPAPAPTTAPAPSTTTVVAAVLPYVIYETVADQPLAADAQKPMLLRRLYAQSPFAGARTDHPAGQINVEQFGEVQDESGTLTQYIPLTSGLYAIDITVVGRTAGAGTEFVTVTLASTDAGIAEQTVTLPNGTSSRSAIMFAPLVAGVPYTIGCKGPSVLLAGSAVKVMRISELQILAADAPVNSAVADTTISGVQANGFPAPSGSNLGSGTQVYVTMTSSRALANGEQFALTDAKDGTVMYLTATGSTTGVITKTLTGTGVHDLTASVVNQTTGQSYAPSNVWSFTVS